MVEYFDWQFYRKCGAEGLSDQVEVARRGRVWAGNGSGTTPANVEQLGGCPLPPLSAAECASAAPVPAAATAALARNSRALCTASRRCQIASWTLKLAHAWVLGGVRLKYGLGMVPRGGGNWDRLIELLMDMALGSRCRWVL